MKLYAKCSGDFIVDEKEVIAGCEGGIIKNGMTVEVTEKLGKVLLSYPADFVLLDAPKAKEVKEEKAPVKANKEPKKEVKAEKDEA